jgi:hypothetical protein
MCGFTILLVSSVKGNQTDVKSFHGDKRPLSNLTKKKADGQRISLTIGLNCANFSFAEGREKLPAPTQFQDSYGM